MKKAIVPIFFLSLLLACSTQNKRDGQTVSRPARVYQKTIQKAPNSITEAFSSLEGCSKEFVFDVLGLPTEKAIDGKKYFYWELSGNNTNFWTGNINSYKCTIHAQMNQGVIESINYTTFGKGCNYIFADIVRYYTNHNQDVQNCPNRNDFYGKFIITEEY